MPRDSGVYVPVQLGYEPKIGRIICPGTTRLASATIPRDSRVSPTRCRQSGPVDATHNGNTQFWLLADQMLVRNGPGDQDGLIALGGFVHNDADNSPYANQYFAGLLDYGFWRARPQDGVGLLFSYFAMSGALGNVQAEEPELGSAVQQRRHRHPDPRDGPRANYNIHVYRGVDFRPEFEYVHPAERPERTSAMRPCSGSRRAWRFERSPR